MALAVQAVFKTLLKGAGKNAYDKSFNAKNQFTAILGAEQRATVQSSTTLNRMGYNDNNLQFQPVNYADLNDIKGTQSLTGSFQYSNSANNYFTYTEDRYVSAFANAAMISW